jgi:8-oxo-dGTP diphosphatase
MKYFMSLKQKNVRVSAGIIINGSDVLIAKRPNDKHQGGLWEFPGGKIEKSESAEQALKRELLEELNINVQQEQFFKQVDFDYFLEKTLDKSVSLKFFIVSEFSGEPKGLEGQIIKWVPVEKLGCYDFPDANQLVVEALMSLPDFQI